MDIYGTWELYYPSSPSNVVAVLSVYPTARSGTLEYTQRTFQLTSVTEMTPKRLRASYSADRFQGTLDAQVTDDGGLEVKFTGTVTAQLRGRKPSTSTAPTKPTAATPASTGDPIEDLIRAFESRPGNGVFPRVSRTEVAKGLRERVKDPSVINQGHTWMCGPAAFMYSFASDRPLDYVKFVTKLYDDGSAVIRSSPDVIAPSRAFCGDAPAPGMPAVDWIALGSLRDSTNWIFDYRYNSYAEHLRGGTTEHDVIRWFNTAGYLNIQPWTTGHGQGMNARLANQYFADGYKVCLRIDSDLLGGKDDADSLSIFPNHFVILTSPIRISDDGVTFTVYTWRDKNWQVPTRAPGQPAEKMPLNTFLGKYYGFIAAKP